MLRLCAFATFFTGFLSVSAFACPDLTATGSNYVQVTTPYTTISLEGIGGIAAAGCGGDGSGLETVAEDLSGYLPANPSAVFDVQSAEGDDLVFSTAMTDPAAIAGEGTLMRCDTVMMIQSPDGTLSFSDDGGSANLSLLTLPRLAGAYKVWAGSYSEGQACEGEIRVADRDLPCPAANMPSVLTATSADQNWTVTAGGPRDIRGCNALTGIVEDETIAALGFIDMAPTLEIPANVLAGEVETNASVNAVCDTVLVGLNGEGEWSFSDDAGESLNPSLTFSSASSGAKIWVGTYDIASCGVDLTLAQQIDASCPSPALAADTSASLGSSSDMSSDGSVDLSACGESLNGFSFDGYTSANPAASLTLETLDEASSLMLTLTSSCTGSVLTHYAGTDGADIWEILSELPLGSETLPLPGVGTYSFWLINDVPEACSGSLTFEGASLSCPDPSLAGKEAYSYTLSYLLAGQRLPLIAGGNTNIANCAMDDLSASGTYIDRPDFVIETATPSSVVFEGEGQCDTTLLVNDGNGTWHYSDDDAPDSSGGYVSLGDDIPGPYQVWVGTFGDDLCEGALTVKRGLFKD